MTNEFNYPPVVYKYRSWTDGYHRNMLIDNELYLSSPKDFNDPFDCRIPENFHLLDTTAKIKEYVDGFMIRNTPAMLQHSEDPEKQRVFLTDKIENHLEEFQAYNERVTFSRQDDNYGVLSLSSRWDSILMWSHYSDRHRGVCIGFHEEKLRSSGLFGRGGNVICSASDDFPQIDPRDQDMLVKATIQTHSKSKEWAYEDEYRLTSLLFPGVPAVADRKRFVEDNFFAEVTVGMQCPVGHVQEITAVAVAKGINVFQAKKVPFKFLIDREQIA